MKKWVNDPKVNRTYNYLYELVNIINNKTYIGVHRTDKLNDGYMGSGVILKRAKYKYGIQNFTKTILEFFDTYQEALNREREIVTPSFINENDNYNVKEGGYGNCEWSKLMLNRLSEAALKKWEDPEYRQMMDEKVYQNCERNEKISKGRSKWIKDNPEAHAENMSKINKNPDKIAKTAEAHRGMHRTDKTKKNISDSLKILYKENPKKGEIISGKGSKYIYNLETKKSKRVSKDLEIPNGWISGTGPRDKSKYVGRNSGSFFGHDPKTLKIKRFQKGQQLPDGWIRGRPKKS